MKKNYASPVFQQTNLRPEDILTISTGELLDFDSNDLSDFGKFNWKSGN